MIFGSEPPLYLRPVARRGLRRHEAEILQHYPGYTFPLPFPNLEYNNNNNNNSINNNNNNNMIADTYDTISTAEVLRHEREVNTARNLKNIKIRQQKQLERTKLINLQREEYKKQLQHAQQIAGISIRNEPGDGRDTITRQHRSREAQVRDEIKLNKEKEKYFARQQCIVRRDNPHGYDIITGREIPGVVLPPL